MKKFQNKVVQKHVATQGKAHYIGCSVPETNYLCFQYNFLNDKYTLNNAKGLHSMKKQKLTKFFSFMPNLRELFSILKNQQFR